MKILHQFPPNYATLLKHFPHIKGQPVCFAWGDTIYNPLGKPLPEEIVDHEMVHQQQQKFWTISLWWFLYIWFPRFRLWQEIPAHRVEVRSFCKRKLRPWDQLQYINHCASNLATKYGIQISYKEALSLVQHD